jgi:hypothetical protein
MGLVKTRRLAAMQKMQRAKFGTPPLAKKRFKTARGGKESVFTLA